MTNDQIVRILREAALALKHDFDAASLRFVDINNRSYVLTDFPEFKRDLLEAGSKIRMLFLEYSQEAASFQEFLNQEDSPLLLFQKTGDVLEPVLLTPGKRKDRRAIHITESTALEKDFDFTPTAQSWLTNEQGQIIFFVVVAYQNLVSEYDFDQSSKGESLTPVRRLLRLMSTERKDILYILFYAIIIGLTGLILPLGIQSTVELISGGVVFSSVYVLIAMVIVGVLAAGGLQIMQISLVEYLQQRVFTKAALEFSFRIPRIRIESILNSYAPELVNRFFDILTIQKGLPKLLIDLSSGTIQILFGLILLSLYHPFFVFFSLILVATLVIIFYLTGAKGLDSSIQESKYKYKVAQWLEELARALNSFKLAGTTDLPIKKTDYNVNNYLKYRKIHFRTLITQFSFILLFKAAVTGGLLIMGTILVIDREITLGQFVASEVIIILILNAVEKIIMYMDVVYDLLTAVDKIAQVTDLPLEKVGGIDFPKSLWQSGYSIATKDLRYKYPNAKDYILKGVNLDIKAGERICITGSGGSGKTTLTNILTGMHPGFDGIVTINNYSIRDLDLAHLRDKIAKNISPEDIFDGTIYENITVGKPMESVEDAIEAMQKVGLADQLNALPEGLSTPLLSGGKGMSSSMIQKMILARCLAKKPGLLILNDFFSGLKKENKLALVNVVISSENPWTLIAVSNDPIVMAACDRVIVLQNGIVAQQGTFEDLVKLGTLNTYID
ncbi:ATP-binding cassette domain-containing protein [Chryseolinea sp. Jin1]|uniref:ATP-binding cassette domain-containing protein n=1 Tax=Chryseolinea lacunae TaxID=2801331 RepID=A0ABS1KNW3_9BACT|nr:ATP-binding cassette domain-containing protein [Chryseolinea lacunae]MBL0739941.1 ATP-binding cassette domain-containing protein [Chryseolinea lacunae]